MPVTDPAIKICFMSCYKEICGRLRIFMSQKNMKKCLKSIYIWMGGGKSFLCYFNDVLEQFSVSFVWFCPMGNQRTGNGNDTSGITRKWDVLLMGTWSSCNFLMQFMWLPQCYFDSCTKGLWCILGYKQEKGTAFKKLSEAIKYIFLVLLQERLWRQGVKSH